MKFSLIATFLSIGAVMAAPAAEADTQAASLEERAACGAGQSCRSGHCYSFVCAPPTPCIWVGPGKKC
ncbi:hypothetical protein ACHAQH_005074 [Verticillium albo-atrum]